MKKYKFKIPLTVDVVIESELNEEQAYKIAVKEAQKNISQKLVEIYSSQGTDYKFLRIKNYRVQKSNKNLCAHEQGASCESLIQKQINQAMQAQSEACSQALCKPLLFCI